MIPKIRNNKIKYSKNLVLLTLFILLTLNWNFYSIQVKIDKWNPLIMAVALTIALLLICDIKTIIRDKWFILIILINAIAFINMTVLGTGYYSMLPLYCISLGVYLSDKIKFGKRDILLSALFIAFFFFYWTVDVKGYFKGYTINYGGLVLVSGFIFAIFTIEYFWYVAITGEDTNKILQLSRNKVGTMVKDTFRLSGKYSFGQFIKSQGRAVLNFFRRYPYIITAIEVAMFFQAYNIIAWYRSRTAFLAIFFLAMFMLIPRKLYKNKCFFTIVNIGILAMGFMFPVIYEYVGARVNVIDYQMFYKPDFDSRLPVWGDLFAIYRNFLLTGVGTLYTTNEIYRPGILDTMNAYLDLLFVYGPFVCLGVLALIAKTLLSFREYVSNNRFAKMAYAGAVTMLVASYTESMVITVPFALIFILLLSFTDNIGKGICFESAEDYRAVDLKKYENNIIGKFGTKIQATSVAVFLPLFLVLGLGSIEVYYSNYDEFSFTNFDYIFIFGALLVITFAIVNTVVLVLPRNINKVVISILTAISVASYIQYMFLNKNLIMEDGEFIEADGLGDIHYKVYSYILE